MTSNQSILLKNTLFITASDTGVGKTHITSNLLRLMLTKGVDARAIKSIETGFDYAKSAEQGVPVGSDVHVYSQVNPANNFAPAYYFDVPASPHYSASLANSNVDIDELERYCQKHISASQVTLIEGAGGLLVPFDNPEVGKSHNFTHLIKRLNCPIILVINNQLGAINQALTNIQLCAFHGIEIAAVVMNQTNPDDAIALDNISFVQKQTSAPVIQINQNGSFEQFAQQFDAFVTDFFTSSDNAKSNLPQMLEDKIDFDKTHLWHPYTSMLEPLKVYHVTHAAGKHIYISHPHLTSPSKGGGTPLPKGGAGGGTTQPVKLLDAMSSWWAVNMGYNRDVLNQAAIAQINQFSHVMFGGITHDPAIELGKALIDILPAGLDKIFYADSGSVSVEVAIKMALQYQQGVNPQKHKVLTPLGGYHGDTFGAMSVCDPVNGMHGLFNKTLAEQIFIPRPSCRYDVFNKHAPFDPSCLQEFDEAVAKHKNQIAAVIIEPIVQGTGGMWPYHPEYLKHVRKVCDAHDIVLIFDEIATGFGRTGQMFASDLANVVPDIICLGKALTGGFMSFACTVTSQRIAEGISHKNEQGISAPFMHGPTYMANPLACAVAKAAIDGLQTSDWQTHVNNIEGWLKTGLTPCLNLPDVADVRVLGAIGIVEMQKPVDVQRLQAYFITQGVWIRPFGKLIYTMPHFNFNKADVSQICKAIYNGIVNDHT